MSTNPDFQQEASDPKASKQPDQGDKSIDENRILRWARRIRNRRISKQPTQHNQRINKNYILRQIYRTKQNTNSPPKLIVLGPHYDEKHHGLYVEKLEQAVRNPKVRNIALTGGYGTGKSSVIQGLVERIHSSKELKKIRPITISLPTIQIADDSDSRDDSTDRIQREIVKQLLYRSNPWKLRGSQYRRITHITVVQRAIACFIVAAILTFIFWLLAKPDWHWHWSQGGSLWGYWQPAMVQAILWGLTFYIDWTWVNKPTIAIKGLQLGPAKLELEKNDFNYFDKYLNEIIYYFEVSKTNLVVFEDLDRFDDPYIFDALHELNELINISLGQERFTEQKKPPVRFLYTIRDSIFEYKTQGIIENAGTRYTHRLEIENRTKFFDVIVPIFPFSTSRNAYEYLKQLIDNNAFPTKIDRKLLKIVGSEVSDYRLLANIVSEFQIFTERISVPWDGNPKAKDFLRDHANYLFAFVVYKNTHLIDYEKLQTEDSDIDKINKDFLNMRENIRKKIEKLFNQLAHDFRLWIARENSLREIYMQHYTLSVNDESFDDFATIELWSKALSFDSSTGIRPKISLIYSDKHFSIDNDIFVHLIKTRIEDTGLILSYNREVYDLQKIISTINAIMEISNISSLLSLEYSMLPTEMWQIIDGFRNSFQEKFNHDIITQKLIQQNYINENFYIYSSIFTQGALASITSIAANANTPPAMRTA